MYFIGIDLGTSAVKLILADEEGRVCSSASEEYPICFPKPGWAEQNPSDWYEKTILGLKRLTEGFDRSKIRSISFSGQMHGLTVLDQNDSVLRPAILWNDGRCGQETDWLNETVGKERLTLLTGNIAFAGFTAPKLLWMKNHEPELFARIRRIMLPKDYLNYRLTGAFCTDYSDAAGTLLLDVKHKVWSEPLLKLCGVTSDLLPRLCESYETTGKLLPEIARELDFPEDVLVAAGAADNAAAAVGNGILGGQEFVGCSLSLGTSGTILIPAESFPEKPPRGLHLFSHSDGAWYVMGCMLSAASCWKWWADQILLASDYDAEQALLSPAGPGGVFFLPYLMGERSPHNDPDARAAFIGMNASTSRQEMSQAVLEGVLYGLRDSLEEAKAQGICPSYACICGGGAKSPLWKAMAANILGLEIRTPEKEEGPAFGAAVLAAVAGGAFPDVKTAVSRLCRVKETILPDAGLAQAYDRAYRSYRLLYPALKEAFKQL